MAPLMKMDRRRYGMNRSSVAVLRPRPFLSQSADDWFIALDQRRIGDGAAAWIIEVLGIHREPGGHWVQIATSGNPFATLVLRVTASTHLDDVLTALEWQRPSDQTKPEIIDFRG